MTGKPTGSRLDSNDNRFDPTANTHAIAPSRFGTSGLRETTTRKGSDTPPSSFGLRPTHGEATTDRFGRSPISRLSPGSSLRDSPLRASIPSRTDSRNRESQTFYRPPAGAASRYHTPSHNQRDFHFQSNSHHGNHHGNHHDHHHGDHHGYGGYPYGPAWWGPAYTGFGLTWHSGSFALSIGAYAPFYPRSYYYDSWYCGGWGYSSVYYGGWSSGWYGGCSYVYNPWPTYRTYYLYEPYPVTETIYITQPATTTVIYEPAATTASYAAPAPNATAAPAYAVAPAVYASVPQTAPTSERVESAETECLCPCQCNGVRACTCEYPCGSEDAWRDDYGDWGLSYISYADNLSPEIIWTSYAGLDRWDASASGYAAAAGDSL